MKKIDDYKFDITESHCGSLSVPDFHGKYEGWSWRDDDLFLKIEGLVESLEDALSEAKAKADILRSDAHYDGYARGVKLATVCMPYAGEPFWIIGDDEIILLERHPTVQFIFPDGEMLHLEEMEEATITVKANDGRTFTRSLLTGTEK